MSEEALYNAMVRHQIYLEGFKSYQGSKFSDTAKALEAEYKRKISNLEYETLDELTKAQLTKFIRELRDVNRRLYDGYIIKLIEELEEFMTADYELVDGILDDTDDDMPTEEEDEPSEPPAGLWGTILNDPLPGVGALLTAFLVGVGLSAIVRSERLIWQAWSNNWTKRQLLDDLIGEPKATSNVGTNSGLVARVTRENQAAVNTVLQHIAQQVAQAAMRRRYKRYRWVSVLDNRTTTICKERDGNIYFFGAGPLPPAHINCRSQIVPVVE